MLVAVLMLMQGAPLDCADPYTQMAMNRCAVLEFQESDAELNAQWKLTAAEMKRRDAKKGLATLCIGGGMGVAMCVERP